MLENKKAPPWANISQMNPKWHFFKIFFCLLISTNKNRLFLFHDPWTTNPPTDPRSQLRRNFAYIQLIWRQGREWDSELLDLDLAGGQLWSTMHQFYLWQLSAQIMNIRTATGQWLLSAISDSITLNTFYPWISLDDVFCVLASCQTWHNPTFCTI